MVDSGATSLFINHKFASQHQMLKEPLENPIQLFNIDGSLNEAGSITHKVKLTLRVGQDREKFDFFLMSLGPEKVILGLPWLCHRKPQIDWQEGTMRLNADQCVGSGSLQLEVTKIAANRMECRRLLADQIKSLSHLKTNSFDGRLHLFTTDRRKSHSSKKEKNVRRDGA